MKFTKVDKEYLTDNELLIMENKVFSINRIEAVRGLFVFCCYTGLAYVDVMNLKPEHIVEGFDGKDWIKTCRQKIIFP